MNVTDLRTVLCDEPLSVSRVGRRAEVGGIMRFDGEGRLDERGRRHTAVRRCGAPYLIRVGRDVRHRPLDDGLGLFGG